MYRGTTPTLRFEIIDSGGINVPLELISELYITFAQDKTVKLERKDAALEENIATITLTQEETLLLSSGLGSYPLEIQLRGKFVNGAVFATNKIPMNVEEILKDGEI